MKLNCVICDKEFVRFGKQALKAKCCSFKCLGEYNRGELNQTCTQCNKKYHLKESSSKRYKRKDGYFCSASCYAKFKSKKYSKEGNHNYQDKLFEGGYKLIWSDTYGRIKMYHAVAFEILNINKLPRGFAIHHRDCNHLNDAPNNLVLLSASDHWWLHKQYGNATLWAYMNDKIDLKSIISWSNDPNRAEKLLTLNILKQIGVFKSDEFGETLVIDNTEPSISLND